MLPAHKLKLLSGPLDGVEFTLSPGDTIFHVGPARTLHQNQLGATLANADNVFYIPGDLAPASFRVHVAEDGVRLEVRAEGHDSWSLQALPLNSVVHVAGLALAVRAEGEPWSAAVLDHRLPVVLDDGLALPSAPRVARAGGVRRWAAAAAVVAVVATGGWWAYDRQRPATQVRTLEAALAKSPYTYSVVHDADGRLYAFGDSAEAVAWGQRASQRAGRLHDQYRERHAEAARIGAVLDSAGVPYAVIRLRTPQQPEVVITALGLNDAERRRQVQTLLGPEMPYASSIDVRSVGDAQLVEIARAELRARGISTRAGAQAGRASVANDVFLDDASLHAMARYRDDFVQEWGERRVRITIRLWDDLFKGRSYQYSQDQLLSVGEGRWEFSTAGSR
ncbi:PrgH/EprH family type III secretion apparatus protein [Stenotrophomonas sp. NPDC077464]|uniref:PrgH/EprH family type III secretion apparatus protein n=1 Tax=unclassified Stenotrophomonas TaxID=196198 RepID=UPI0037D3D9AA